MANALYDKGRNAFCKRRNQLARIRRRYNQGDPRGYRRLYGRPCQPRLSDDVPAAARVASATLTLSDPAAGVCDAGDVTFSAVTGDPCEALIIYKDTGTEATSPLLAYIDTATGLPVTPNGGNITVTWDSGANKIFKL